MASSSEEENSSDESVKNESQDVLPSEGEASEKPAEVNVETDNADDDNANVSFKDLVSSCGIIS